MDVAELTDEEISQKTADLTSKLIYKRQNEGLIYYEPYPEQLQMHVASTPIRALVGRNKGGKSYAGAVEMLLTVGKVHPWRPNKLKTSNGILINQVLGRSCCVDFPTLRQTLIPIYRSLAPRNECILPGKTFEGKERIWPGLRGGNWSSAYNITDRTLSLANGSIVEFMSYVQDREAFGGPVRHIIHHDEEPPDYVFGENLARQSTVGADMIFTLTPIAYSQWLYNLLCEQAVVNSKVTTIYIRKGGGPPLDEDTRIILEELVADPAERAARLDGQWTVLSGRVLKDYGNHNLIDPPPQWPEEWPIYIAIDPHEEKPTAVTWMRFDRYGKTPYIYRELIMKGDVRQICNEIKRLSAGENVEEACIDISARKSATIRGQGSIIDLFEEHLPKLTEGSNYEKDVQRNLLKGLVRKRVDGQPRFFVTRDCPVTHNQLANYSYKPLPRSGEDRAKAQVVKKNEDCVDTVLYHIQMIQHEIEQGESYVPTRSSIGVYGNFNIKSIGM